MDLMAPIVARAEIPKDAVGEVDVSQLGVGRAAEVADLPRAAFMRLLSEHGVPVIDYPVEDLQKELRHELPVIVVPDAVLSSISQAPASSRFRASSTIEWLSRESSSTRWWSLVPGTKPTKRASQDRGLHGHRDEKTLGAGSQDREQSLHACTAGVVE